MTERPRIKQRTLRPSITIDGALTDASLLGTALGDPQSWLTWRVVLRAAFGLPLDEQQQSISATVAGGRLPPPQRVREVWAIVGRRGGKSRRAAAVAVYLAAFVKHRFSAGEHGLVLVLAATQEQAKVVFGYAKAFLTASPVLRQEIDAVTRWEIRLKNGITIAIHSNGFRTIRGRTLCAAVFDEVAMWRDELSATPDTETYTAVLPALLTTRGMLVGISTGYRRAGLLYQKHRDHYGQASTDTLVVQGSTVHFNQTLKPSPPSGPLIQPQQLANGTVGSAPTSPTSSTTSSLKLPSSTVARLSCRRCVTATAFIRHSLMPLAA